MVCASSSVSRRHLLLGIVPALIGAKLVSKAKRINVYKPLRPVGDRF